MPEYESGTLTKLSYLGTALIRIERHKKAPKQAFLAVAIIATQLKADEYFEWRVVACLLFQMALD